MVDKWVLLLSLMDLKKKALKILLGSWFGPSFLYSTTNSKLFIKIGFHFWDNVLSSITKSKLIIKRKNFNFVIK